MILVAVDNFRYLCIVLCQLQHLNYFIVYILFDTLFHLSAGNPKHPCWKTNVLCLYLLLCYREKFATLDAMSHVYIQRVN